MLLQKNKGNWSWSTLNPCPSIFVNQGEKQRRISAKTRSTFLSFEIITSEIEFKYDNAVFTRLVTLAAHRNPCTFHHSLCSCKMCCILLIVSKYEWPLKTYV